MSKQKDELLSGSELARRINVNPSYIAAQKKKLIAGKCTYGKKFYFIKSCELLGRDPNNLQETAQSSKQKTVTKKNIPKKPTAPAETQPDEPPTDEDEQQDVKELLQQIKEAIDNPKTTTNRAVLDGLKAKAGILTEYYKGLSEKIKNRKLEENLFERDEVIQILSFTINMIRNAMINLPNTYAVNLEGLAQAEIKEYVTDDINRILEDLQGVEKQFD